MKPSRRLALIPLIMLLLAGLACDAPPLVGITCLYEQDGNIIAPEERETWISRDAGFTWESVMTESILGSQTAADKCGYPGGASPISDPANPLIQYRFTEAWSIERSEDGGETWRRELDLRGTDARTKYYQGTRGVYQYYAGPLDAMFHTQTGNLIVAMGYEGVLIRTTDGVWHWQGVGKWYRVNMLNPSALATLLLAHMIVGLMLALVMTLTLRVLAAGWNALGVLGGIIGSYLGYFLSYHGLVPFTSILGDVGFLIPVVLIGIPILMSWLVAKFVIKPRHLIGFMFTCIAWIFLSGVIPIFWLIQGFGGGTHLIYPTVALGVYVIAGWLLRLGEVRLLRWRIGLGIACFTAFMIPYVWWGIGGIAFEEAAMWWSLGFAVMMVVVSIGIMKKITPKDEALRSVERPSMRDVPASIG